MAKNIDINVKTNTLQSEKAFKKLEGQAGKTALAIDQVGEEIGELPVEAAKAGVGLGNLQKQMARASQTNLAFNRVIQDSPFFFQSFNMGVMAVSNNIPILFESFVRLKAETGSTKQALKGFLASFTGPQGFLSIISLAVSAGTALSFYFAEQARETKKATEELDKYNSTLNSFIKVTSGLDEQQLEFQAEALKTIIPQQERQIKELEELLKDPFRTKETMEAIKKGLPTEGIITTPISQIPELEKELDIRKKVLEQLQAASKEYEIQLEAARLFSEYLKDRKEQEPTAPKWVNFLEEDIKWFEKEILGGEADDPLFKKFAQFDAPIGLSERELREKFRTFDVIANESARTLFHAFSQAWTDIFGEANSLFEQLMQNIAMGLFDLVAQDISKSIFESLIPGGSLIGAIFGGGEGLEKRGTTLVQIGEQPLNRATSRVIPNVQSELERRKVLD